jgi:hypothetical protein
MMMGQHLETHIRVGSSSSSSSSSIVDVVNL